MASPAFPAQVRQNDRPEGAGLGPSFCSITARHKVCDHSDGSKSGLLPKHNLSPITLHIPVLFSPRSPGGCTGGRAGPGSGTRSGGESASTSPGLDGLMLKTADMRSPRCQRAGNRLAAKQEQNLSRGCSQGGLAQCYNTCYYWQLQQCPILHKSSKKPEYVRQADSRADQMLWCRDQGFWVHSGVADVLLW